MKKFKFSFLLYSIVSIYTFDNVYSASILEKEVEAVEKKTSLILTFFSTWMLLKIVFAVLVIVLTFFISKIINIKLTSYLERVYSLDEENWSWEELIWVITRTINVSTLVIGFSITLAILWIDMWIFMWWIWFWIGFTLKTFLTNFIAWIMMVTQWFYHNWDLIEIGWKTWKIKKIHALFTMIEQFSGVNFFVPNIKFMEEAVSNYNTNDKRRIEVEVSVDYDTDITKAKKIIIKVLESFSSRILPSPDHTIIVSKLDDSWILLKVRFWIPTQGGHFIELKSNVTETINLAFKQSGIIIPFPQITISNREEGK